MVIFHLMSSVLQGLEEQNWYVGAVGRVEAEHALHLVNRVKTPSKL